MKGFDFSDMLDDYIFETNKMLDMLETLLLVAEEKEYDSATVNEIFRLMHSMKGAAATMLYDNVASLCHAMEDIFSEIRDKGVKNIETSWLTSMLLICKDFLSEELAKISEGKKSDGDASDLVDEIRKQLQYMKHSENNAENSIEVEKKVEESWKNIQVDLEEGIKSYFVKVFFQKDAGMLNVRALILVQRISETLLIREHIPYELTNEQSEALIIKKGLQMMIDTTFDSATVAKFIEDNAVCVDKFEISEIGNKEKTKAEDITGKSIKKHIKEETQSKTAETKANKGYLSVAVSKLDQLMDITSEIIIIKALMIQKPDESDSESNNFDNVSRQFKKITNELQDIVMSLRMIPIAQVFQKMKRIVRDVSEKMGKEIDLTIIGEGTEVDKNIIELVSDPLMHIIRNSIDHGIEMPDERVRKGKTAKGEIIISARHIGSEVWIEITDNGAGLNKEKIYKKAYSSGLTQKSINELKDSEIYKFIFQPGFSTKEETTEYSGRGVGMDVVYKNIEKLQGNVVIEKTSPSGTTMILKIPLTLSIINGMTVKVGETKYTIPMDSIVEIISLEDENILMDTEGREIITIRNRYYSLVKLYERFKVKTEKTVLTEGMALLVQTSDEDICIFADSLIGEQQVVVKALPDYLNKVKGISGCSILGDGTISLIIDTDKLIV